MFGYLRQHRVRDRRAEGICTVIVWVSVGKRTVDMRVLGVLATASWGRAWVRVLDGRRAIRPPIHTHDSSGMTNSPHAESLSDGFLLVPS